MTHRIRSLAFNFLFFGGSLFFSIALLWTLLLPQAKCFAVIRKIYFPYLDFIEKYVLGLDLKIEGLEHLPADGAFILAAKHQSAYETLKLFTFLKEPAIVLKRELTWIPLWGWYPLRMGMIAIDRGSATEAMSSILKGAQRVKKEGRPIVIFPQGTRVAPGVDRPYRGGIAKIYKETGLTVVPMALNSGVFWGRNAFWKKSGTVTFRILPPIAADLPPQEMMDRLKTVLERESDTLVDDARKQENQKT